jgi:hypothetical protein
MAGQIRLFYDLRPLENDTGRVYPIIAKYHAVGAAFSRESRLKAVYAHQGAPTARYFAMIG